MMMQPRKLSEAKTTGEPGWKWRKLIIYPVVAFGCWQLALLVDANDTRVNETLSYVWGGLVTVLVLTFTGFATVQDIAAIWRTGDPMPYRRRDDPREHDRMP